ncbi:MAG: hypothetical protein K1X64_22320, partial [Myxococcaceae bacterium]|nr:hypothetical protein [Myxococcaceae bacterium]
METVLGVLVLVPVLFYGIHFTELIIASTKVTEAASAAMWDSTAYPMHLTGVSMSYPVMKKNSIVGAAKNANLRYGLAFDGRFTEVRKSLTNIVNTGRRAPPFMELFTVADAMEVRCASSDALPGPPLEYSSYLVGSVIPDTHGIACRSQAVALNVLPQFFFNTVNGGFFQEDLNKNARQPMRLCPIGHPNGKGGPCLGTLSMLTDDWGLASAKFPIVNSRESDSCTITLGTPIGVLPCENPSYYLTALNIWSIATFPMNPIHGLLSNVPFANNIPGFSTLISTVSISPHRTLVAATVGTTPSMMATDTAFYMAFRGDETMFHTFTPSTDWGITGQNDFMLWETTPFLTPPMYA